MIKLLKAANVDCYKMKIKTLSIDAQQLSYHIYIFQAFI